MSGAVPSAVETAPDPEAPRRIAALDGLRGIAALIVVVSHGADKGLLPAVLGHGLGETGVVLFFVLSGFLMAYLYADTPFSRPNLAGYARHRIGRVVPLYIVVVLLGFALNIAAGPYGVFPVDSYSRLAQHLLFIKGRGVLWTIPIEVQFYFVFAALWAYYGRVGLRATIITLAVAVPSVLLAALFFRHRGAIVDIEILPFWLHFFVLGAVAGLLWRRHHARFASFSRTAAARWLGAAVLLAALLMPPQLRVLAHIPILPIVVDPVLAGVPVLIFVAALLGLPPFGALATRPLRKLGDISYGVYIIHLPVLALGCALVPGAHGLEGLAVFCGSLIVVVIAAWLSFQVFEIPARRAIVGGAWRRRRS